MHHIPLCLFNFICIQYVVYFIKACSATTKDQHWLVGLPPYWFCRLRYEGSNGSPSCPGRTPGRRSETASSSPLRTLRRDRRQTCSGNGPTWRARPTLTPSTSPPMKNEWMKRLPVVSSPASPQSLLHNTRAAIRAFWGWDRNGGRGGRRINEGMRWVGVIFTLHCSIFYNYFLTSVQLQVCVIFFYSRELEDQNEGTNTTLKKHTNVDL